MSSCSLSHTKSAWRVQPDTILSHPVRIVTGAAVNMTLGRVVLGLESAAGEVAGSMAWGSWEAVVVGGDSENRCP